MEFVKDMMRLYLDAPTDVASTWFNPQVSDLLQKHYGLEEDRMRQEKLDSNRFVLERLDTIREKVEAASDPLYAGLQFAVLGNYLDFGALQGQVSFEKLEKMLEDALEMQLDRRVFGQFCEELQQGRRLLYLTDNAGEIGFDRVFA